MGMYDTLHVRCPACGGPIEFQSKAGPCSTSDFTVHSAPVEVLRNLDGTYRVCGCGSHVTIRVVTQAIVIAG